jgi:hypothetical protein
MQMFAFLGAVIDGRWTRFERANMRDPSLLAKDFMVGVMRVQILSVKETYSCTAAEVWYRERQSRQLPQPMTQVEAGVSR